MSKSVYGRLAFTNLKNNARENIPYFITAAMSVMMFYIMMFLACDKFVNSSGALAFAMVLGCIVIGIFSVIFLFYTNSFLIKRRRREFGLYNVLGMEKKHICRVLANENMTISAASIIIGLGFGILFSKLTLMFLAKIIDFDGMITFKVSPLALIVTTILFLTIFILTLIYDLAQINMANPVELLHGSNSGEREPKTKWFLAIAGTIMLGIGYYIALTTENPVSALGLFFIAVILVIFGTYCLFIAGSIAVLKVLRKNKNYYYKLNHFTSVSGMLYRMKKNAVGLANVCILSTMVLVMLSTTSCLFIGFEDSMRSQYPRNISLEASGISADDAEKLYDTADAFVRNKGYEQKNVVAYRYVYLLLNKRGNNSFEKLADSADQLAKGVVAAQFMTVSDYNRMTGKSVTLKPDEVILLSDNLEIGNTVSFAGRAFSSSTDNSSEFSMFGKAALSNITETGAFVFADEDTINSTLDLMTSGDYEPFYNSYYGFDLDAPYGEQSVLAYSLQNSIVNNFTGQYELMRYFSVAQARSEFLGIYGGLFFLGIILGILFITATVLIIYYKQVSEGYEDKSRFEIMQKVGMTNAEVKKTIRSQVLTVFFLPLLVAVIHVAFAFKLICRMFKVLAMTNIPLFGICTLVTIGVFTVFYIIVYLLTAKTYYRIVE